jgi:hypothetical protein
MSILFEKSISYHKKALIAINKGRDALAINF